MSASASTARATTPTTISSSTTTNNTTAPLSSPTASTTSTIGITTTNTRSNIPQFYPGTQRNPIGTRVFFWGALSAVRYGTIQSVGRLPDGTLIAQLIDEDGKTFTLPLASLTLVYP